MKKRIRIIPSLRQKETYNELVESREHPTDICFCSYVDAEKE